MSDPRVLAAAYVLDWCGGDPEWFPHPVRLIGKTIEGGERLLRQPEQIPLQELLGGSALTVGLVAGVYLATAKSIDWARRQNRWLAFAAETVLAWTCLASRSLHDEASAVIAALDMGDIVLARLRLARIVGRDTRELGSQEICRAVIETVAESASDGVIAPLFYLSLGGAPLAMAYKAVNTLDSMIGHADQRYFYFGKTAARLDDVANLLPSRVTALCIAATAFFFEEASPRMALAIWTRDGNKHQSPNAGQPESAMAGALQVRLGGTNIYDGQCIATPLLGEELSPPSAQKAKQAIQMVAVVSVFGALAAIFWGGRRR